MKNLVRHSLLLLLFWASSFAGFGQAVTAPDCSDAVNVCTNLGFTITTNGIGNVNEIPTSGTVSNPSTAPTGTGTGCLLSGEINSTWMVVNIASSGQLEFTFGGNGTQAGFYDWIMWPYNPNTTCNDIIGNTLPPVACNWNASSIGGTGMGTLPAGANAGNYVPALNVTAGQQYIICFTNFSGLPNTLVPLDFTGSAAVSCSPVNQAACQGDSVQLVTGSTIPGSTFLWTPAIGLSSTTDSVVMAAPPITTTYTVSITDPAGNITDTTVTVTIHHPPTPDAGMDDISCDLTYNLNATLSDTFGGTWTYTGPSSATFADDTNPSTVATVTTLGNHGFIFTEDNTYCPPVSDTVWVNFLNVPHTNYAVDPSCGGACDGRVDISAATAVLYSIDGGLNFQVDSFFTGLCAGTYDVVVENAQGCQQSSQFTITDPPIVEITSITTDSIVCIGGTASFGITAAGGDGMYSYVWDNALPNQANHTVTPTGNTCYIVYVEDGMGCQSAPDTVCVGLYPPLIANASNSDSICPGDPIDIGANAMGGIGAPYTYVWDDGAGWSMNGDTITVSPNTLTNYCVTVTDGCETPPANICLSVGLYPVPDVGLTVDVDSSCVPVVSNFTNTTTPSLIGTSLWDFGDGNSSTDPVTTNNQYLIPGCYDVSLTVTSPNGCVADTIIPDMICGYGYPTAAFDMTPQPTTVNHTEIQFLNYSSDNFINVWTFDSLGMSLETNPMYEFPNLGPGTYPVTLYVENEYGCSDSITHEVVINEDFLIYVPNAFSPNGDGINDQFVVVGNDIDQTEYEMSIYDRWGNLVFLTEDLFTYWDGTKAGLDVQVEVYVWKIKAKGISNGEKYEFYGHVTLIR